MLDTTAAEAAVAFIRDAENGMSHTEVDAHSRAVIGAPAYWAWASNMVADPDELLATLRGCPPKADGSLPAGLPGPPNGVVVNWVS